MPSYRPGIYCRNGRHDSLLLQKAFGQARRKGTRQLFGTLARTFLEILRPAWRKEVHGSHAWQDPNPQWTEYARILAQLVSDASARIATLRRWQARQRARRVHHRIRLDEQADRSTRLLSLCFGNICRSPYAAYRLERILCSNAPSPCWHIESSGILPKPGRQPPHEAQIAAQTLGTPIDAHSSRHSAPCDLTQHHVILIFDRQNLHHLRDTGILGHPGIAVAMLGDYLPPSRQGCEISDPYGGDINEFIQTYRVIDEGLTALTQATQRQHTS
ncbi:hypothetical protein [Ectothiorhodospira marina]|nr:hypothetical protein [Ectothiorhodospira marina]